MSTEKTLKMLSGRENSRERRRMLSKGKAALPQSSERVRTGFREASLPVDKTNAAASQPQGAETPLSRVGTTPSDQKPSMSRREALLQRRIGVNSPRERIRPESHDVKPGEQAARPESDAHTAATTAPVREMPEGGRAASVARRRALSQGKAALPQAIERVRTGFRDAALPQDVSVGSPPVQSDGATQALERSAAHRYRQGSLRSPVKMPPVTATVSQSTVTGFRPAAGHAVTGTEAGRDKPLTGTQYVAGEKVGHRSSPGKVGHARTLGGLTVSGTMVRSAVKITGDEGGAETRITGNADQTVADDLNGRGESVMPVGAQFVRQTQPHGRSVFGSKLDRSAPIVGSRHRETERPVEQTLGGHAVSGTAIGRYVCVTGSESGAHRGLTGTQYLAPFGHQATQAPASGHAGPATGTKVTASQTWGGQTVTGPQMEHNVHVTGSERGTCQTLTGTPYYGASGAEKWCDPEVIKTEAVLRDRCTPPAVTGNVPMHHASVSGMNRGAHREITGSVYFVAAEAGREKGADPVAQSITGFSIGSPQRMAHLAARAAETQTERRDQSAITGTFAHGEGKITGNLEFAARPRTSVRATAPARSSVTGEGAVSGAQISGTAWGDNPLVTGTESYISAGRNPSSGGEHAPGFSGARRFKSDAPARKQTSRVTGAVGGAGSRTAVTLSGGATG